MTPEEIHIEYMQLFQLNDSSQKLERIRNLSSKYRLTLPDWASLFEARAALMEGQSARASELTNALLSPLAETPSLVRVWAQILRGDTYFRERNNEKALTDYTAVIEDPAVQMDQRIMTLVKRGLAYEKNNEIEKALADYTTVTDDPEAQVDQRAMALVNSGVAYVISNKIEQAIANFTAVIDDLVAPMNQRVIALLNRGVAYGMSNEIEKAIADFTTVIKDPATPVDERAKALTNRGIAYGMSNETEKAIADFTTVIDDPAAQAVQRAKALTNRGIAYGMSNEIEKALADFTTVIKDPATPVDERAMALVNRGAEYVKKKEIEKALADFTAVINDPAAPASAIQRAILSRSFLQRTSAPGATSALERLPIDLDEDTKRKFRTALAEGRKRKDYFFEDKSLFAEEASLLLVLREWNSYTPSIPDEGEPARGGGYFIKHRKIGIVIDPGFDFLEIFHEAGGRLCDITHIVVTHAHSDHTADLEAILSLLYEFNDKHGNRAESNKRIAIYMSQGAARKLSGLIQLRTCTYLSEVVTLNRGNREHPQMIALSDDVVLTVLPAYHDDIVSKDYSIGLGIEIGIGIEKRRLLLTGDTAFLDPDANAARPAICDAYPRSFQEPGSVDLLLAHIGSIEDCDLDQPLATRMDETSPLSREGTFYDKHLGLRGTFFLLYGLRPKACIISEFGEEMRTIWISAVRALGDKLNEVLKAESASLIPVFAGDPVLVYDVHTAKFLAHDRLTFENPVDLRMVGIRSGDDGNGPTRPYLFTRKWSSIDIADAENAIRELSRRHKERQLPHFSLCR